MTESLNGRIWFSEAYGRGRVYADHEDGPQVFWEIGKRSPVEGDLTEEALAAQFPGRWATDKDRAALYRPMLAALLVDAARRRVIPSRWTLSLVPPELAAEILEHPKEALPVTWGATLQKDPCTWALCEEGSKEERAANLRMEELLEQAGVVREIPTFVERKAAIREWVSQIAERVLGDEP